MKKRKYTFSIVLLLIICWTGYQMYWYLRNNGNVVVYISNGAFSFDDVKENVTMKLYIDDELVSEDIYRNGWLLGDLRAFVFKLNLGFHKIAVKAQVDSTVYEKEIKIWIDPVSFVRWVDFELVPQLGGSLYYDENGKLIQELPFDTIQRTDIIEVHNYEFLTRRGLCPLQFE